MQDYSDIIYLTAAMVIFSILSAQASRMILINDRLLVESEIEYHAVALAQDYIDQIRWMKSESELNNFVSDFAKTIDVEYGDGTLPYYVDFVVEDYELTDSNVSNKIITIIVKSQYIGGNQVSSAEESPRAISLKFLKSF